MEKRQYIEKIVRDATVTESLRQLVREQWQRLKEEDDDEPEDTSYNPNPDKSEIHTQFWNPKEPTDPAIAKRVKALWKDTKKEQALIALGAKITDQVDANGRVHYTLRTYGGYDQFNGEKFVYESDVLVFNEEECLSVGFKNTMPWAVGSNDSTSNPMDPSNFLSPAMQAAQGGGPSGIQFKNTYDPAATGSAATGSADTSNNTQDSTTVDYISHYERLKKAARPANQVKIILKADADAAAGDQSCEGQQGYLRTKPSPEASVFFIDTCVIKIEMEEGDIWDKIANILDYIGVIPVIGDIADLINVCIYAAKGRWLEAALSAIAIIPVIGSAIAIPLKALFKGTRKVRKAMNKVMKSKDATQLKAAWGEFWKIAQDGLNPQQAKVVTDYMGKFPDISKTWAVQNMDTVFGKRAQQEVAAVFENLHKFIKAGGEAGIERLSKKTAAKSAGKSAAEIGSTASEQLAKRAYDIPYIKRLGVVGDIANVPIAIVNKVKGWAQSSVMFTKGEMKMFERQKEALVNNYRKRLMKDPKELSRAMLADPKYSKELVTGIGSKNTLHNYYDVQARMATDPTLRGEIVDNLMKNIDGNIFFQSYRGSAKRQILSATGAYGNLTKNMFSRFKMTKSLDVMYNEVNGLMQSLGYGGIEPTSVEDVKDNETGVTTRTKTYTKQDFNLFGIAVGAAFDAFTGPETKAAAKSTLEGGLKLAGFVTDALKLQIFGPSSMDTGQYAAKRWVKESNEAKTDEIKQAVLFIYDITPGEDSDAKLSWSLANIKDPEARKRAISIFAPTPQDDEETKPASKQ